MYYRNRQGKGVADKEAACGSSGDDKSYHIRGSCSMDVRHQAVGIQLSGAAVFCRRHGADTGSDRFCGDTGLYSTGKSRYVGQEHDHI